MILYWICKILILIPATIVCILVLFTALGGFIVACRHDISSNKYYQESYKKK